MHLLKMSQTAPKKSLKKLDFEQNTLVTRLVNRYNEIDYRHTRENFIMSELKQIASLVSPSKDRVARSDQAYQLSRTQLHSLAQARPYRPALNAGPARNRSGRNSSMDKPIARNASGSAS